MNRQQRRQQERAERRGPPVYRPCGWTAQQPGVTYMPNPNSIGACSARVVPYSETRHLCAAARLFAHRLSAACDREPALPRRHAVWTGAERVIQRIATLPGTRGWVALTGNQLVGFAFAKPQARISEVVHVRPGGLMWHPDPAVGVLAARALFSTLEREWSPEGATHVELTTLYVERDVRTLLGDAFIALGLTGVLDIDEVLNHIPAWCAPAERHGLVILPAVTPEHFAAATDLVAAMYREILPNQYTGGQAHRLEALRADLAGDWQDWCGDAKGGCVWLAFTPAGEPVGVRVLCGHLMPAFYTPDVSLFRHYAYVLPEHRRHGISSALLATAVVWSHEQSKRWLTGYAQLSNADTSAFNSVRNGRVLAFHGVVPLTWVPR